MITKKQELKELVLNKELNINEDAKKAITTAEGGRYSYFDYDKKTIQKIAEKRVASLKTYDIRPIIQALFPDYLIGSGLFDAFLMFEIKNGVRIDPPKFYYYNLFSYLNNNKEKKFNKLLNEIEDLFKKNNIAYHESWEELFKENQ